MNAGKSTVLLQSSHNYHERGMSTLLFTPIIDTRFGLGKICSRIWLNADAVPFNLEFDLYKYVITAKAENNRLNCILIDEAQFLTKSQVIQLSDIVDELNIPVLAYGLRSDFLGEPFEGSKYLLTLADNVIEIKTICHCGRKATMNMRIDANNQRVTEGAQIEIGGNERYISTCRKHFKSGQVNS